MLRNKTGEPCEVVAPVAVKKATTTTDDEGDEPEPPEPFRFEEDD
jgi:hypothetical protein